MDEELRALEQRVRASPGDVALAVRLGRALARSGERGRAAEVLARAVERDPTDEDALRALDQVAPRGLDPLSPWPGSIPGALPEPARVKGPDELRVRRRVLDRELDLRFDLAVDSLGRLLATDPRGLGKGPLPADGRAAAREAPVVLTDRDESRLVSVSLEGLIEPFAGELPGGTPILLAGWVLVASRDRLAFVSPSREVRGELAIGAPWTCGLGRVVSSRLDWVESVALGAEPRVLRRVGDLTEVGGLAIGPGGVEVAHTTRGVELIGGSWNVAALELEPCRAFGVAFARENLILSRFDEGTIVVTGAGKSWRRVNTAPIAIAGANRDIVVTGGPDGTLLGVDLTSGKERFRQPSPEIVRLRVDARGRLYWRRGDALVAMDPESGAVLASAEIGSGWRDFAFAGEGRIALLRRIGVTRTELVVVE